MLAENNRIVSNSLKKKFLYYNDINSINLLINIYESEENFANIKPQYISMGDLRKIVKIYLRGREGNDLAARNISKLIHNDINRFELLIYLESYKLGYHSIKFANTIEKLALANSDIESMYSQNHIRGKIEENIEIINFKKEVVEQLKYHFKNNENYKKAVSNYNKIIIKNKLFNLNQHLDKQIKMVESENGKMKLQYETIPFTNSEIISLYKKMRAIIFEDGIRTIVDAYWSGLIEKVLSRYK